MEERFNSSKKLWDQEREEILKDKELVIKELIKAKIDIEQEKENTRSLK